MSKNSGQVEICGFEEYQETNILVQVQAQVLVCLGQIILNQCTLQKQRRKQKASLFPLRSLSFPLRGQLAWPCTANADSYAAGAGRREDWKM